MGDGGREEGMSMGKGLTWMGDGFLLPCWCCASQLDAFKRSVAEGPGHAGTSWNGKAGASQRGRSRRRGGGESLRPEGQQ